MLGEASCLLVRLVTQLVSKGAYLLQLIAVPILIVLDTFKWVTYKIINVGEIWNHVIRFRKLPYRASDFYIIGLWNTDWVSRTDPELSLGNLVCFLHHIWYLLSLPFHNWFFEFHLLVTECCRHTINRTSIFVVKFVLDFFCSKILPKVLNIFIEVYFSL